jgi:hypothetical protein
VRRLLLLDVLADNCNGRTAAATGEVGRRPQRAAPQLLADAFGYRRLSRQFGAEPADAHGPATRPDIASVFKLDGIHVPRPGAVARGRARRVPPTLDNTWEVDVALGDLKIL